MEHPNLCPCFKFGNRRYGTTTTAKRAIRRRRTTTTTTETTTKRLIKRTRTTTTTTLTHWQSFETIQICQGHTHTHKHTINWIVSNATMQSRNELTMYLHKPSGIFFQKDSSTLNCLQTMISRAHLKNADSLCFLLFQDLSFGLFCVLTATKDSCDLYKCGRITVSFNHPKLKTSSCLDSAPSLAIRGSAMLSSSLSSSSSSSSSSCLGE